MPPATRPSARFWSAALQEVGGTVAELARRYDMNRSHLQMLLKKHGLHSKDFRNRNAPPAATRMVASSTREMRKTMGDAG